MGKHTYVICFRCGEGTGPTQMHPAYGCRRCRAKLTDDQKTELRAAMLAKNRAQREIEKTRKTAQQARVERRAMSSDPDSVLDEIDARKAARGQSDAQLATADAANTLVARVLAEQKFIAQVDKALAPFGKIQRCSCCFTPWHAPAPVYEETWDGKLLCQLCAYGVIRCGACPIHNNVLYPEIAKTVPRIHPRDFPPAILAPFDPASFP
ncbi:MAG: hypothetical protein WAV09_03460 [Minisyncoccia bacterium]